MLLKPTLAVPHGGGTRLEVGSPEYARVARLDRRRRAGPDGDATRDSSRIEVFPRSGDPEAEGHAAAWSSGPGTPTATPRT